MSTQGGSFNPTDDLTLSGAVRITGPLTVTGTVTGLLATGPITSSGLTQPTGKLLGRSTAGTGAIEAITVGSNLTLSAGTLSATGGGAGAVQSATVTLTDAQIKALPTTPFELVAAQGAGTIINFLSALCYLSKTTGAYTNVDAASWLWIVTDPGGENFAISNPITDSNGFGVFGNLQPDAILLTPFTFAGAVGQAGLNMSNVSTSPAAALINQPLMLQFENNGDGNFTGGDAANTLKIVTWYGVMEL